MGDISFHAVAFIRAWLIVERGLPTSGYGKQKIKRAQNLTREKERKMSARVLSRAQNEHC